MGNNCPYCDCFGMVLAYHDQEEGLITKDYF